MPPVGTTVQDLFPTLSENGDWPVMNDNVWEILDPNSAEGLMAQLERMLTSLGSSIPEPHSGTIFDDSNGIIHIHPGAKIGPCVLVEGPAFIGENAEIRQGAYVRKGSWICARAVIGHCTEVKHSLLLPDAKAPHFNYVGDSILGTGVNLGAGCKLSNLRNDGRTILIRDGETGDLLVDSGLRKFGAVLGEGVQLGCNVVTNPGTIMETNSGAWPNVTVSGLIKSGQTVKE